MDGSHETHRRRGVTLAIRSRDFVNCPHMDSLRAQDIADRDQLWANLRILRPEIERLSEGGAGIADQKQQLAVLLARIVLAELDYRDREGPDL